MFKQYLKRRKIRQDQRRLKKARKLILKSTDQKIGTFGKSKVGTVLILKDIRFSIRHNKIEHDYRKVTRGEQITRR